MADVIRKATNKFTKGLIMDFSPENTKNEVLTHALNATLLTFNGNELSLLNDMGNVKVETAYLPEGYIPVGVCEYGGIVYIVSYNPLEDKSLIGCFPSPERNISNNELGKNDVQITSDKFVKDGIVTNTSYLALLKDDHLNPGDKFIIHSDNLYQNNLQDLFYSGELKEHPRIALNVVSIEDSGKIVYLNSDIKQYKKGDYEYHILETEDITLDISNYRNAISSGYSIFKSKTSGRLAILAELVTIDSYSVTHSVIPTDETNANMFDIVIHTDVEPVLNESNKLQAPKLKYYYLENSQGFLSTFDENNNESLLCLMEYDSHQEEWTDNGFNDVKLSLLFTTTQENLEEGFSEDSFQFPLPKTYHGLMRAVVDKESLELATTYFFKDKYHKIDKSQIQNNLEYFRDGSVFKFYEYDISLDEYTKYNQETIDPSYEYYVKTPVTTYINAERDVKYLYEKLYKTTTYIEIADDDKIEDKTVEKFQNQLIDVYRKATESDISAGTQLWYRTEQGGKISYSLLVGNRDPQTTYYVKESKTILVSIGFEVDKESVTGVIYCVKEGSTYLEISQEEREAYFNFEDYPRLDESPLYGYEKIFYLEIILDKWEKASETVLENYQKDVTEIYYKKAYNLITDIKEYNKNNALFVVCHKNVTLDSEQFIPNTSYNNIQGFEKEYTEEYPKDDAIKCSMLDDYIPSLNSDSDEYLIYPDIKLASIKFPEVLYQHGVDLPFKYDYTIVPCMDYGKLPSLAVSNTVDFSKLHDFNKSNFNVWKYKVTEDLLTLTIGTEIFDTFSSDKVNGLHIEFYDHRGFAGSLEINNKKSYSGLFTKILQLNTRDVLSKNKLVDDKITSTYKHNVSIDENKTLNGNTVTHDKTNGWNIDGADNDCGTLFSNLLYIAKAYLRVSKANGEEGYIEKNQFSLFTMPLLNDYYNSISNYNEISDLQLDLLLTYKLTDNGTLKEYNDTNYVLGYSSLSDGNKSDLEKVREYKSGKWDNPSLQVTKYYQYTGTSKLQLEVGLKEEYSKYGFFYDSIINNNFSCDITLMNDVGDDSVLMYKNGELMLNKTNEMELSNVPTSNFQEYNFINTSGTNSVNINYNFVVNYGITVEDIAVTEIPCTTICALCHQNDAGDYNYSDFGIYQNNEEFYSDIMFYNSGTNLEETFGICKQNAKTGPVQSQVSATSSYSQASIATSNYGKLNAGDPLKSVANRIPKLAFVLPHAHGIDPNSFTGIVDITYPNVPTTEGLESPIFGTSYDKLNGKGKAHVKTSAYFPRYTSSMLTKNVVDYQSVFIPTINRKITHYSLGYDRIEAFDGFSGTLLVDFNKKLLLTMKSVYVYNPDYSSQVVNEGKLNIENVVYTFTNNIISSNAKLNIELPEDYIHLHSFKFTEYKELLSELASISDDVLPTLSFNLEYCGELKYLITPLSYDLKTPNTLGRDLNIDFADLILVKTESGLIPVNGTLNKRSLYGWDANVNNLIKLNPLNHIIDKDGSVVLHNQTGRRYELFSKYTLEPADRPDNEIEPTNKEFTLTYKFNPDNEIESTNYYDILECEVKFKIHDTSGLTNYLVKVLGKDVIICKYSTSNWTVPLKLECTTKVIRGADTTFEAYLPKILFKMCAKTLKTTDWVDVSGWDVNKLIKAASRNTENDLQKNPSNLDPIIMNGVPLKSNTRHEWANLVGINEFQLFDEGVFESLHGLTAYGDNDGILIYHIELSFWDFAFERKEDTITRNNVIINNDIKGYDYQIFDELRYKIKIDSEDTLLRGTSICLSDLEYDPNSDHRLYIKQNFRIPHEKIGLTMDYLNKQTTNITLSADLSDSNKLRFHLGPCFTPDNL